MLCYPQLKRFEGLTIPFFTKYLIIASLKKRQYFPKYTYV